MLKSINTFTSKIKQIKTLNLIAIQQSVHSTNQSIETYLHSQTSLKMKIDFYFSTKKYDLHSKTSRNQSQKTLENMEDDQKKFTVVKQKNRKISKSLTQSHQNQQYLQNKESSNKIFNKNGIRQKIQKNSIDFEGIKNLMDKKKNYKKELNDSNSKLFRKQESIQKSDKSKITYNEKPNKEPIKKLSFYQILTEQSQVEKGDAFLKFLQKQHQEYSQQSKKKVQSVQKIQKVEHDLTQEKIYKPIQNFDNILLSKSDRPKKGKLFSSKVLKQSQLTTLHKVITDVQKETGLTAVSEFEQNFFPVLNPSSQAQHLPAFGFWYYLLRYCKYHVYFSQTLKADNLISLKDKIIQMVKYYCLGKSENNKDIASMDMQFPDDRLQYMERFLVNLLPSEGSNFLNDIYLEVGIKYFTQIHSKIQSNPKDLLNLAPSNPTLYMVLTNIKRLIFGTEQDFELGDSKEEDYTIHRAFFTLFLDFYCIRKHEFETADKITCVQLAKFLKIQHPEFLQFIKETLQTSQQNYSTVEFLIILGYLVQSKNTPYEYFYKNKGTWMKIIESSHDFSDKKTKCCIKFLQILSRERFVHCEKIYFSLLQSIENNLEAMEGKQLVRTLYFYSKARYGTNPRFLSNLVQKISRWLPFLQEIQFSLLVRAIGNLNYQSAQLVESLKNINYERFLCELKFGCENLGSYYQEILKEVQEQSKGRIEYFQGDQFAVRSEVTVDQTQMNQG